MYLSDYTIPEAEVIYQKAIIRGGWWFLAFLVACVLIYFVAQKITQDRHDERSHKRNLARIKASGEIGQTGFSAMQASQMNIIRKQQKDIEFLQDVIVRKNLHILRLEKTMKDLHYGDVAEKIRKEAEYGTNESEDRS